jgi:hypothetical protein
VIDELNEHFVNTWLIPLQFAEPDQSYESPTARKWASTIKEHYTYPVDSIVLDSGGRPVGQMAVEEVFANAGLYRKMLERARAAAAESNAD